MMSYSRFNPDEIVEPLAALRIEMKENSVELPVHRHRKGQLVLALRGIVTCEVDEGLWIVPPGCAVWIPSEIPHSNHVSAGGQICVLFIEPTAVAMPERCCTLSMTPLLRELIFRVADLFRAKAISSLSREMIEVLLRELQSMPIERLHLPISTEHRLRKIAEALIERPHDRTTMEGWAKRVATSERSLARLIKEQTGMTFGQWRQQLHLMIALQRLSAGKKVESISEELGYESTSSFITMFKKALGKSPGKYLSQAGFEFQHA
jgi:AraC-like DNA-binding protein